MNPASINPQPKEEEKKQEEQQYPPLLEPFKIKDWDAIGLFTMRCRKIKHRIRHPYAHKDWFGGLDLSKFIEVEVHGEMKDGVPHGQCFLSFIYKGEL